MMSGILKEFYYGNLESQLRLIRGKSKLEEEIQLQNEAEVQLLQTLQDDEKAWFTKYIDTTHKINDASLLDCVLVGFRLGSKFTYDTFVSEEAPFSDFSID